MLRAMLVLIGLIVSAGTAAQDCPGCAAADVCIRIYKNGVDKIREDLRAGSQQFADGIRDMKLDKGEDLIRRGAGQMKANAALSAELHVNDLKNCLNKIR